MREPTPGRPAQLTDQQTLHDTMTLVRRHLPLTAAGYRCQTEDLWRLLVGAAARPTTLEALCADLADAPDANTVRGYLTAHLSAAQIPTLEDRWNDALAALLPAWLLTRPQEVAVDVHESPMMAAATRPRPTIGSVAAKRRRARPPVIALRRPMSCSAMCA